MHYSELDKFTIHIDSTIIEAIKKININGSRFIIVIDDHQKVIGLATDGDIRRSLLDKVSLKENISLAMNKNFHFSNTKKGALKITNEDINFVPIIDEKNNKLKDILFEDDITNIQKRCNVPALIMAGGFGKRLMPLTHDKPKPMLEISGIPLLEITINYLRSLGINRVLISTFYLAEKIVDYFGDGNLFGIEIDYIHEDSPSGTAGCLGLIPEEYQFESLLVINGDILTRINYLELIKFHNSSNNEITISTNIYEHQVPYGVLNTKAGKLLDIEEKPLQQFEISAGIYMINRTVINNFVEKNIEIDMPDLVSQALKSNGSVGTFPIHEYWLDIGKRNDFDKAQSELDIYFDDMKKNQ